MSLASVKAFLLSHAPDLQVVEVDTSTATVAPAVNPGALPRRCRCASAMR